MTLNGPAFQAAQRGPSCQFTHATRTLDQPFTPLQTLLSYHLLKKQKEDYDRTQSNMLPRRAVKKQVCSPVSLRKKTASAQSIQVKVRVTGIQS